MKQLKCEMCGSTDLVKQDGLFVCQVCGTKYSVEEAKKMMVEGTVEVQGTVKVDNSSYVQKYLENARRAKAKEDWEETEKYYNMVEQNDPNNIEAIFYSAYGKAKTSLVSDDIYKRQAAFKVLINCIDIISERYQVENGNENEVFIRSISNDLLTLLGSSFVYTERKDGYGNVVSSNRSETYELYMKVINAFCTSMIKIEAKSQEVFIFETVITFLDSCKKYTGYFALFTGCSRRNLDALYDKQIDAQKILLNAAIKKVKKQKVDAYWASHKEEKEKLDKELSQLQETKKQYVEQIAALQKKKEEVPAFVQLNQIKSKIEKLQAEKKALGLFKTKEKQAIQVQIDSAEKEKEAAAKQAVIQQKEINGKIEPIRAELNKVIAKIKAIENELTKDR